MKGQAFSHRVITKTANAYLEDQSSELEARNISGCEFSKLYDYVEAGYPVIVWTTMYMSEPVATDNFCEYEGHEYQWFSNEHCVVFMGFHKDTNEVGDQRTAGRLYTGMPQTLRNL